MPRKQYQITNPIKAYFITLVDKWQCQIIVWDWKILK